MNYSDTFMLSAKSVKRSRTRQGLRNAWNQKHTVDSIAPITEELRETFPNAGSKRLKEIMRVRSTVRVSQ
jgi:hypothetical protein